MEYRREIDGLRALAVVPVIMVHTQFGLLPGGFAGVDVFFVISGYLITHIIVAQQQSGEFSAARFYARRTRRLVPALVTMLAVTAVATWALLMPSDIARLARATASTAAYGSNIYFYFNTDYFGATESELLLHTWSLGVEEQFYIVYPLILLAARRWGIANPARIIAALWIASFVFALLATRADPPAAFYLLPSRMWELATGGLVATVALRRPAGPALSSLLALAGLCCIVLSYRVLEPGSAFPAPGALFPCIGTALILMFGRAGPVHALLALPPLVLIGRWSYSLYLWHWPISEFYGLFYGATLGRDDKLAILALVFGAGAASFYLIERPAMRCWADSVRQGWRFVAAGAAALAATALLALGLAHIPRTDRATARYDRYLNYRDTPAFAHQFGWLECFGETIAQRCLSATSGKPRVLLLGDSYAAQYRRAIEERFPNIELKTAAITGCAPMALPGSKASQRCIRSYEGVRRGIESGAFDRVIIIGRWDDPMLDDLDDVLTWLRSRGVAVTLVGPTVEYDGAMPRFLAAAERLADPGIVAARRRSAPFELEKRMASIAKRGRALYASQIAAECPKGRCREVTAGGAPYHFDFGHLTLPASREMVARIDWGVAATK